MQPTSTLDIWRELSPDQAQATRERSTRLSPPVLLALVGLAAGFGALAGPVGRESPKPEPRRLVVSLHRAHLPHLPDFLLQHGADLGEFDEVILGAGQPVPFAGLDDLRARLMGATPERSDPSLSGLDRPGASFVLSREPSAPTRHARWWIPARPARPGWVAGGTWFDGERLEARPGPEQRGALRLDPGLADSDAGATGTSGLVANFARTYAGVHGLDLASDPGPNDRVRLRLSTFPSPHPSAATVRVGGAQFQLEPRATPVAAGGVEPERGVVLARDDRGRPVIRGEVGRLWFSAATWEAPGEDPARTALALAGLFDDALGPLPGVEPLEDREASALRRGAGLSESLGPPVGLRTTRAPTLALAYLGGIALLLSGVMSLRAAGVRVTPARSRR